MPAAVVGDMCVCVGPPATIVMGSTKVMIGKKPAARVGDSTAHGGTITGAPDRDDQLAQGPADTGTRGP